MRRGVKAFETRRRSRVWSGGSTKIINSLPWVSAVIISSTVPWAELNVPGLRCAASTSANRLSA